MRILYIVTAFPRTPADIITPWLSEMIERLAARGTEVEVLAPSYRGLREQTIRGIRVHRFRYAPALLETLTHDQTTPDRLRDRPYYLALLPGYLLAGTLAAIRLARSGRFDVIHAFWPLPHGLFALAARRASGVPVVSTFFGVELTWLRRQLPFLAPVVRRVVRSSDGVTVISSHTAAELRALTADVPVRVIPFGAATGPVSSSPRERLHGEPGSGRYRLLFVGRLVQRKGVDVLIRAIGIATPEHDLHLTVVGDGPMRGALEELAEKLGISERVQLTGLLPQTELQHSFEECDAFVLPAVEDAKGDVEGLGVVLIEALAHARPVIATRSGGIPDIVVDGRTGLLVEPGDAKGLAEAIIRLKSEPALAAELVRGGRAHIEANFSWDSIVPALQGLYAGVAERSSPRSGPIGGGG